MKERLGIASETERKVFEATQSFEGGPAQPSTNRFRASCRH